MSHYSLIKIKIKNPNEQLLFKTLEEVAKIFGGSVVRESVEVSGRKRIAIIKGIEELPWIDVWIHKNGSVTFGADFYYANQNKLEELQLTLVQKYTANALTVSLKQLGYQVQQQTVKDKIYVKAVSMI